MRPLTQLDLTFGLGPDRPPIVLSNGYGLNSLALAIGLRRHGIVPDLILHSDVGAEKEDTIAHKPLFEAWLQRAGFPATVTVKYQPKKFKHWPPYHSLEENILTNISYPSIAYGGHTCSVKWKIQPMNAYVKAWQPARDAWSSGQKVQKLIGYDAGARDTKRCSTFQAAESKKDYDLYDFSYLLQDWGWDRDRCQEVVWEEGILPRGTIWPKSSCYFCQSMKPHEVAALSPRQLQRIVIIEARAQWRSTKVEGLWRKGVKGCRGATPHPGLMSDFIQQQQLLPAGEVERLRAQTATHFLYEGDIPDWQTWLDAIAANRPLTLPPRAV